MKPKPPDHLPQYRFRPNFRPVVIFTVVGIIGSALLALITWDWRGLLVGAIVLAYPLILIPVLLPVLYNTRVATDQGDELWTTTMFHWTEGRWSDITTVALGARGGLVATRADGTRQYLFWSLRDTQPDYTKVVGTHLLALPFDLPDDVAAAVNSALSKHPRD